MPETTFKLAGLAEVRRLMAVAAEIGQADRYGAKRKTPRIRAALWLDFTLDPAVEADTEQIQSQNISETGIGFWLRKRLQLGQVVYVRDHSDERAHLWLKARVHHCTTGLRGFLVGCEFQPVK